MIKFLRRVSRYALDAVFPSYCVCCGTMGHWWCPACRNAVELLTTDPCPACMQVITTPHDSCGGLHDFGGVVSVGYYHSKPLRRLIHGLKYEGLTASTEDTEAFLQDALMKRSAPFPWAQEDRLVIQPMPLTPERERERGYNQARWIAERFRHAWLPDAPIIDVLARRSSGIAQATIEAHEARAANVQGEFVALSPVRSSVILVDDVVTTGSTAGEAARALIRAGAFTVYLLTLAVGK